MESSIITVHNSVTTVEPLVNNSITTVETSVDSRATTVEKDSPHSLHVQPKVIMLAQNPNNLNYFHNPNNPAIPNLPNNPAIPNIPNNPNIPNIPNNPNIPDKPKNLNCSHYPKPSYLRRFRLIFSGPAISASASQTQVTLLLGRHLPFPSASQTYPLPFRQSDSGKIHLPFC
jgi:hypothetical protein